MTDLGFDDENQDNLNFLRLDEDCPTVEEVREIVVEHEKRQKRLLRNRELAKQSRERRREALKQTRLRCCELEKENENLKMFVYVLKMDNIRLHGLLGSAPPSPPPASVDSHAVDGNFRRPGS